MISLADLLEAEGVVLRRATLRTAAALGLAGIALLLAVAGLGLCLWVAYQYLATILSPMIAALLLGLVFLVLGGLLAWLASRLVR